LPWQSIYVGFVGFYPQNWVRVPFGRWRRTTRSASAAHDAGEPINNVDVENVFYVFFLFWSLFNVFNVFFIFQTFFLFLKDVGNVQSGKEINKKHFENNSNEIERREFLQN